MVLMVVRFLFRSFYYALSIATVSSCAKHLIRCDRLGDLGYQTFIVEYRTLTLCLS